MVSSVFQIRLGNGGGEISSSEAGGGPHSQKEDVSLFFFFFGISGPGIWCCDLTCYQAVELDMKFKMLIFMGQMQNEREN